MKQRKDEVQKVCQANGIYCDVKTRVSKGSSAERTTLVSIEKEQETFSVVSGVKGMRKAHRMISK